MTRLDVVPFLMEFNDLEAVARDAAAPSEGAVEILSSLFEVNVVSWCVPGVLLELASRDVELKFDFEKLEFREPGDIELASIDDGTNSLDTSSALERSFSEVIEALIEKLDIPVPVNESAVAL